jgi:hypothetical protein
VPLDVPRLDKTCAQARGDRPGSAGKRNGTIRWGGALLWGSPIAIGAGCHALLNGEAARGSTKLSSDTYV